MAKLLWLEYGSMWHICEEALARSPKQLGHKTKLFVSCWDLELKSYAQKLCQRYKLQQHEVEKWYNVCRIQFPVYIDYWSKHPDVTERTPLLQEQAFCIPYKLPSGRVIRLKGKFDSVDLIGKGKDAGI